MKKTKRHLAIFIALLLLIAMIPAQTFAIDIVGAASNKAADIVDSVAVELSADTIADLEQEKDRVVALTSDSTDSLWNEVFTLLPVDVLVADGKFATEAEAEAAMINLVGAFAAIDYFGSGTLGGDINDVLSDKMGNLYNTFGEENVNAVLNALVDLDDSTYDYAALADVIAAGTLLLENSSTTSTLLGIAADEVIERVPASLLAAAEPALTAAGWDASDVVEAAFILAQKEAPVTPGGGGLGGGGGTVYEEEATVEDVDSSTETIDGEKVTTATIEDDAIEEILESSDEGIAVIIPVSGSSDVINVELSGEIMEAMADMEAILEVQTDLGNYTIPADGIDMAAIAAELGAGTDLSGVTVSVTIKEPSDDDIQVIEKAASGKYTIVMPPLSFEITCSYGDKTVTVDRFESYVERTVPIPAGVDVSKITTAVVLDDNGTMKHIPTKIVKIGDTYYAVFNSKTNSTYAVIYNNKTFDDLTGHWSSTDVSDMASRMIISGVSDQSFEPDRDITRAEFIAIVVRALGFMRDGVGTDSFTDVGSADWYYDAVSIGKVLGISNGNGDGTFSPNSKITREEAMTMTARAAAIAGIDTTMTATRISEELGVLYGAGEISEWASASVAVCLDNELIVGDSEGRINAKNNITRAETATIVKRLLKKADLI